MKKKFKLKSFYILFLVLIIVLSISFIFQIDTIASETKLIHIYTERLEMAEQENELLIINSAKKNSLSNIKDSIDLLGFERIEKVHHIHERSEVGKERFISSP